MPGCSDLSQPIPHDTTPAKHPLTTIGPPESPWQASVSLAQIFLDVIDGDLDSKPQLAWLEIVTEVLCKLFAIVPQPETVAIVSPWVSRIVGPLEKEN